MINITKSIADDWPLPSGNWTWHIEIGDLPIKNCDFP